ncbi:conserved hypothetical protein [Coccidioides posadasii str. Silveira]|uniref:Uncharacterized protein n=2 Tax=Coccidioides posadasii TaxID=199306 RepID=E9CRY7_COCPS|nr:conserved hypothetical protein [Coccidioides posadasii str. Silveira]KMM63966.1 hypothetical protein CPAG_00318 [Coccidioides posadasii RMSCC 3488]
MAQSEKKDTAVVPQHEGAKELDSKGPVTKKGLQFWAIICSLCVTSLLGALENTEIATSLPTIVRALDIGDGYVWVTNALFSDKGIASGGFNMIVDVIVADIVSLRERGNYIAIVLTVDFTKRLKGIHYASNIMIIDSTSVVLYASTELVTPPRLFTDRMSLVVYISKFSLTDLLYWVLFVFPSCLSLGSSSARTSVQSLHVTTSSAAEWIIFQMIAALIPGDGAQHLAPYIPSTACRERSGGRNGKLGIAAKLWQYLWRCDSGYSLQQISF